MTATADETRLRRSDFSFSGFEDRLPEVDAFLDAVHLRRGELSVATVSNVVFVPPIELSWGKFEGCLVNADGQPIPTATSIRRYGAFGDQVLGTLSQPVELKPEQVIDDEVVYLGWFVDHFGHILLETLARTWILDQIDPTTKIVFHMQTRPTPDSVAAHVLEAFGIPLDRILILDRQTTLRKVIVPEALYEISYAAHERWPETFRTAAATIVDSTESSEQPVYLSRRLLSSRQRPIVGEFEMEEVFRENGFLVVHPETMSFAEQVRLVNRHQEIFSSTGSAAYLPLFALRPPRIHMLTSGLPFHDYFLVPRVTGAEAAFCNCFTGDNRPSHYYLPPVLDMAPLAAYLDTLGMLKRPLRATLTTRVRDFQPDADELRLFAYVQYFTQHSRTLPPEIEAEALARASTSWPLSWLLARYSVANDPTRIEPLVSQFSALLAAEDDVGRLAHFQPDVRGGTGRVLRNTQRETADQARAVIQDRLLIDLVAERAKRIERRRARRIGNAANQPAAESELEAEDG